MRQCFVSTHVTRQCFVLVGLQTCVPTYYVIRCENVSPVRAHLTHSTLTPRVCFRNTDCIVFVCSPLLQKRRWLHYSAHAYSPVGKDCSALHAVADVACLYGGCIVHRSLQGYGPAPDGHSCVSQRRTYLRVPTGPNTFPLGGTETSSKTSAFPARSVNSIYKYLDTIPADFYQTIISDNRHSFS